MNKQDLVRRIALDANLTQKQAADAMESMLGAIMESVAAGEKVKLVGFGTFEAKQRNPRSGHTPLTREAFAVPPFVAPTFKAGKGFKAIVNGKIPEPEA